MKKLLSFAAVMILAVSFAAYGSSQPDETTAAAAEVEEAAESVNADYETEAAEGEEAEEEDEENYNTGDASLDDPLNADEIGENELLVVSFGTSFNDSRRQTIGAIESAMIKAFPDYSVRRGFTSQIIIDHVKKRDNVTIDNLTEALDRAVNNGVKTLVVQPTHLMSGFEYTDVVNELGNYSDAFEKIAVGQPILTTDEDFEKVIGIITDATKEYDDGETAIIFMGHGTEADSNGVYAKMQEMITADGFENYYIGTVEATPSLDDVVQAAKDGGYKKVVLEPLMIVCGDHANNDMAGDEEDSWKSVFEKEGFEVECVLRGLGELPGIQEMIAAHAKEAVDSLQ